MDARQSTHHERLARLVLFLLLVGAGFASAVAVAPRLGFAIPADGTVELHARMPENGGWSLETLHAEVGQPLRLRLTSDDVMHSFAIGQMDTLPVDLLPGQWQETALVFDRPGRYTYYCTRWCGRNHWRMRGTIIVTGGSTQPEVKSTPEKPLYLRLGLNLDAPHPAAVTPEAPASAERGAALAARLPDWALDRQVLRATSPAEMWQRLRDEPSLKDLDDIALWDAVAFLYSRQVSPAALEAAEKRFATNCAACHGEGGAGDGVMVQGLPRFNPSEAHVGPVGEDHSEGTPVTEAGGGREPDGNRPGVDLGSKMGLSAPPDFTDPRNLLGASPALLEGKIVRGGMGTGMPYWGPIFTEDQTDALIAYLYTFALRSHSR